MSELCFRCWFKFFIQQIVDACVMDALSQCCAFVVNLLVCILAIFIPIPRFFFLFFSFALIVFSIMFCTVLWILYTLYLLKDSSQCKLWWWRWWMPLLVHFYYFRLPRMKERGGRQRQRGQRDSWSFHIFEQEMRHSKLNFAHCLTLDQVFPWPFRKNGSLSPSTVYVRKLRFELSPSFQIFLSIWPSFLCY